MAGKKSLWKNPSYLQNSTGILLFYCSWGIWWSFYSIWLKSLGLSNEQVGTVYSFNSLATLFIMFGYGIIQDRLGIKRQLMIVISAIAACAGPFVQFVYAPLMHNNLMVGTLVGSIFLSAGFLSAFSL